MTTLTMQGTVLEIHDSAWPKFFDIRIEGEKQQDNAKNYPCARLILEFGIPDQDSIGETKPGSMMIVNDHGKIVLK